MRPSISSPALISERPSRLAASAPIRVSPTMANTQADARDRERQVGLGIVDAGDVRLHPRVDDVDEVPGDVERDGDRARRPRGRSGNSCAGARRRASGSGGASSASLASPALRSTVLDPARAWQLRPRSWRCPGPGVGTTGLVGPASQRLTTERLAPSLAALHARRTHANARPDSILRSIVMTDGAEARPAKAPGDGLARATHSGFNYAEIVAFFAIGRGY